MREVIFEVGDSVKALLTSLGGRDIFVVPVGSVMKETNIAGSDMDFSVKFALGVGLGKCAGIFRNHKPPRVFHINGCTFEFKSCHFEFKKSMYILALKLEYNQGLVQFTCDVDVVEQPVFSSLQNTFFVRHYTVHFSGVAKLMQSIKSLASNQNINDSKTQTLIGFGWELLTIIALVQLGKLPAVDPTFFDVNRQIYETMSYCDISGFDYYVAILADDEQTRSFEDAPAQFSELEVLRRISEILTDREDGRQLVIKFRNADIQPEAPSAHLVIVDPCVPRGSLGNNVARAVDKSGLARIRLGLQIIIKELSKNYPY